MRTCTSKKHDSQKKIFETKEKAKSQQILQTTLLSMESKKEVIEDLIEAFANADIPLEKVNNLLPFLKNILKKEVQFLKHQLYVNYIYLDGVFNKHADTLKSIFDSKPVCIIIGESSDNCARSVV